MPRYVDARKTVNGIRFRIFSTITDTYVTDDLTEEEMRDQLLFNKMVDALHDYEYNTQQRIDRAITNGTSEFGENVSLDSNWKKEIKHDPLPMEVSKRLEKEWSEKMARFRIIVKKMLDDGWFESE
ncbi:hypothetical protein KAJ61_03290 [Candidatus Parcubacteria bacterium]|nr:hypothetical protein [Candidatus Parcubacteria bacterium]